MDKVGTSASTHALRSFASRVGHDAVWIAIAGLFCVVEGAVKLTEYTPAKLLRLYRAPTEASSSPPEQSGVFAR